MPTVSFLLISEAGAYYSDGGGSKQDVWMMSVYYLEPLNRESQLIHGCMSVITRRKPREAVKIGAVFNKPLYVYTFRQMNG